jgi:hypothetical protein
VPAAMMRPHVEVLSRLHVVWGAFGLLTGISLAILAVGTDVSLGDLVTSRRAGETAVVVFAVAAVVLAGVGSWYVQIGRSLARATRRARQHALMLAVPSLLVVPFGTALGAYTLWVLLNDDARRLFGGSGSATTEPAEGA